MKTLMKILTVIVCAILGFLVQFYIATDPLVCRMLADVASFIPNLSVPILQIENPLFPGLIYLVCALITVTIITYLVRIFADTKNLEKLSKIVIVFVSIFIGLPISALLLYYWDLYAMTAIENSLFLGPLMRIIINAFVFTIFLWGLIQFFSKQYYAKLKTPRKRCKLEICEVTDAKDYRIQNVVIQNYLFSECVSAMRNQGHLQPKQFYRITEMNWNKKKEVDHWNYYQTGEVIKESEEEFLPKLYLVDSVQQVHWQG